MVAVLLLQTVHGDTEQLVRNPRARQYPAPSSQYPAPSSFTAFTPITKANRASNEDFTITENLLLVELKVPASAFTFKTL